MPNKKRDVDPDDGDAAAADGDAAVDAGASHELERFAQALNQELDRIGYPDGAMRARQLAVDLGLSKMQVYRIRNGGSFPTLSAFRALAAQGVSWDAVIAACQAEPPPEVTLSIGQGPLMRAIATSGGRGAQFVLAPDGSGGQTLRTKAGDGTMPEGAVSLGGLRFIGTVPSVAIVEDDPQNLEVMVRQIEARYSAKPHRTGKSLLKDPNVRTHAAFLVDYKLDDMSGLELVRQIRALTRAPIILTTGFKNLGEEISEAMGFDSVEYLAKPIDPNILNAMLSRATRA